MQNQATNIGNERDQTQLNIAIDSSLHQSLRIQAFLKKQSLREFSEAILRNGVEKLDSHAGKSSSSESAAPVAEPDDAFDR